MKLLLFAPPELIAAEEDAELLNMRGYDAITLRQTIVQDDNLLPYQCTMGTVRCLAGLAMIGGRRAVIHPEADPALVCMVLELCSTFLQPLYSLEELPACPPASQEVWDSLNVIDRYKADPALQLRAAVATTTQSARPLRERWAALKECLLRWEQRFNAFIGDGMKNPQTRRMLREAKRRPVQYTAPNDQVSTTG